MFLTLDTLLNAVNLNMFLFETPTPPDIYTVKLKDVTKLAKRHKLTQDYQHKLCHVYTSVKLIKRLILRYMKNQEQSLLIVSFHHTCYWKNITHIMSTTGLRKLCLFEISESIFIKKCSISKLNNIIVAVPFLNSLNSWLAV